MRPNNTDLLGIQAAYEYALHGAEEGGIPIGAVLLFNNGQESTELGGGKNERVQKGSPTLHGEISALESAGRQVADVYKKCTMVSRSMKRA